MNSFQHTPKYILLKIGVTICTLLSIPCIFLSVIAFGLAISGYPHKTDLMLIMGVLGIIGLIPVTLVLTVPRCYKKNGFKMLKKLTDNNVNPKNVFFSRAEDIVIYFNDNNQEFYFVGCGVNDKFLTFKYDDLLQYDFEILNSIHCVHIILMMNGEKEKISVKIKPINEFKLQCKFDDIFASSN